MELDHNTTITEVARNIPSAARFFEKVGIDYCCGGSKTLETACRDADVNVDTVQSTLETLKETGPSTGEETDWNSSSLTDLVDHIIENHHSVVNLEVPRMKELVSKMCEAHGEKRPEFLEIRNLISSLQDELKTHLKKEEEVLFPYVKQLEESNSQNTTAPVPCFSKVTHPIQVMETEHENAGQALAQIRSLIIDREGCPTCQEFFKTFDAFEADLHQHIHLENNILFPRTVELESSDRG